MISPKLLSEKGVRGTSQVPIEEVGPRVIPSAKSANKPKFPKDDAGFQSEVKRRVEAYFTRTGHPDRDCWQMYLKSAVILAWFAVAYVLLVFFAESFWVALPLAIALALAMAAIGFNIQHDGGHQAYSIFAWVNKSAAMTLDLIGASSYLWHWKHNVLHHTYVNVTGHDTDIDVGTLARLSPHQPRRSFHRRQQFYLWPLYGLMAIRWHLYGDFHDLATGTIGPHRIPRPKRWDLVVFILGKITSIGLLLVLPMFWHPWWVVGLFYLLVTGVIGVVLSVVFQLAHCVEQADFPMPAADTLRMSSAWAVHQVQTTVDFSRGSTVLTWLLGGLNFQIEHHLFPRVCHVHYPALSGIVEQTCREFGLKYSSHQNFRAGLAAHYRWLRRMGRPENAATT